MALTGVELSAACTAVWGPGWQSKLARALDVNSRTVRRWASGETPIPETVEAELGKILGLPRAPDSEWPRDEWIVQREDDKRMYVVHTQAPRFIVRAVECDENGEPVPEEGDADVISGVVYVSGDLCFCEIVWIDLPPATELIAGLMDRAADALDC